MKHLLTTALLAVAPMLLPTACTPYPETPVPVPGPDVARNQPQDPGDLARRQQEQAKRKQEQAVARGEGSNPVDRPEPPEPKIDPEPPAPDPDPQPSISVARRVPGKPGFVFSPFNNKIIDVKDIPSGTLVADPTYPASEKKYFRVP